jgi:zinc D-Ala-D-Ala dipeptidase
MIDRRTITVGLAAIAISGCDSPATKVAVKEQGKAAAPAHPSGLVELTSLDPTIRLDIRYATANNFTGRQLYDQARAFLIAPAADALIRAHRAAKEEGFGLTIYDAYRPWRVTKKLWDATPVGPKKNYVANPKKGSKHNRGCAVDLTLYALTTGEEVAMPSGYDEFTMRAHRNFTAAPADALKHRALLEKLMETEGFRGASNEWWHFDFTGWEKYPVLDIPFAELIQK